MERMKVYLMAVQFDEAQMLEMEKTITEFFKKNDMNVTIPVDVFEVASSLGFDVRGAEFDEPLEGILLVNEKVDKITGFNSNKIIAYNCKKNIHLKKFIVAHELAHYIYAKNDSFDKKIVLAARDHEESYSSDVDEQKMDYMAASILMPRDDMLENFSNKDTDRTELINLVTARYNVSFKMADRRVGEVLNG